MSAKPQAAYIHVPFCSHRCGYCNFTVVADRADLVDDYFRAIEKELSQLESPQRIHSLFVGGGTPTELNPDQLEHLLEIINRWLPLNPGSELTIEANPETFDFARAEVLLAAGVNRISLGIQSFQDAKLKRLDRFHGTQAAYSAIELAKSLFANVSIDLIFASPSETLPVWQTDVAAALKQDIQHISTYGLTFEKGTRFWSQMNRDTIVEVDNHLQRDMYEWAIDELTAHGFQHYEISNFAKPNQRCHHNESYWLGQEYYAFGPGASRYVAGYRETNYRSTSTYLKKVLRGESPVAEQEYLSPLDRAKERLVFGCRRLEGVDEAAFVKEFAMTTDDIAGAAIRRFIDLGFLERTAGRLRLTRTGLFVSDGLWPEFL